MTSVKDQISTLQFGDLIEVFWFDSSEHQGDLGEHESLVQSVGYFLGIKGKRVEHLVLCKEFLEEKEAYHYNNIIVPTIDDIRIIKKNILSVKAKKVLKKLFLRHSIKKRDDWCYGFPKN